MAAVDYINEVRDYLDDNNWNYEYEDDRQLIRTGVSLKSKLQSVKMYITFNDNGYTVIAVPAMKADEASRVNVMEYLTRANYGLRNGNFEMDVNDGEVRYKIYTNAKGRGKIGEAIIEDSIMIPPLMFDKYGNGMAAIMFGFSDPKTEIEKAEA